VHELLAGYGLAALFVLSFCASTLLPLGSEWLVVTLLLRGNSPAAVVAVATVGNSLGSATNYVIGRYGWRRFGKRASALNRLRLRRARYWFNRYGSYSLLLAWLPVIGDPLCLISGMLATPWLRFAVLVTTGKAARYSVLALITLKGAALAASL